MIKVYSTKTCAYCQMVKRFLDLREAKFEEVDVTEDPETRAWLHKMSGYSTVPVTTDGDMFVVGWRPDQIARLIENNK